MTVGEIFRACFMKQLRNSDLAKINAGPAFKNDWVVDIRSVGDGENAILYAAKYIYKIAISNASIISCNNGIVAFKFEDYESKKTITRSLPAMEFIRMFLQHVLPKRFQKVRYDGFLHPKNKFLFNIMRLLLRAKFQIPDKYHNFQHGMKCPECGAAMQFMGISDRAPP